MGIDSTSIPTERLVEGVCLRLRLSLFVLLCALICVYVNVCACVCVREGEKEKESERSFACRHLRPPHRISQSLVKRKDQDGTKTRGIGMLYCFTLDTWKFSLSLFFSHSHPLRGVGMPSLFPNTLSFFFSDVVCSWENENDVIRLDSFSFVAPRSLLLVGWLGFGLDWGGAMTF